MPWTRGPVGGTRLDPTSALSDSSRQCHFHVVVAFTEAHVKSATHRNLPCNVGMLLWVARGTSLSYFLEV
eukprot:scaffold741_cov336-Pavlova_lutheri.AAC.34